MTRRAHATFLALVLALAQAPGQVRAEPDPIPPASDLIEFASEDYTLVEIDGREFMFYRLNSVATAPASDPNVHALSITDKWAIQQVEYYFLGKPAAVAPDGVKFDFQFFAKTRRALFKEDMQRGWMLAVPISNRTLVYKSFEQIKNEATEGIKLPGVTAELDLLVPVDGGTSLVIAVGSGTDFHLANVEGGGVSLGKSDVYSYTAIRLELPSRLQLFGQFGVSNLIEGAADWGSTQEAVLGMLVQF